MHLTFRARLAKSIVNDVESNAHTYEGLYALQSLCVLQVRRLTELMRDTVRRDRTGRTLRQIFDDIANASPFGHLISFSSIRATLQVCTYLQSAEYNAL